MESILQKGKVLCIGYFFLSFFLLPHSGLIQSEKEKREEKREAYGC